MSTPVIFLAFANDQTDHLSFLKDESRAVYRALQALHDKRFIEIYREESADIDSVFEDFSRFKNRLVIFHYSGHAGSKQLQLEGQAANATGLAGLFSEQKDSLQLVFLNGCSTLGQVKRLLDLGIKAVVATSVPVKDGMARDFSVAFYKALSNHSTLEQAFQRAVNFITSKNYKVPETTIHRSLGEEANSENDMPFGLYLKENMPEILQWKLPQISVAPPREVPANYAVNQGIMDILVAMEKYNPDIFISNPRERERKAPVTIRENFPWPMSAQIRMLFSNTESMNKHGMLRLKQLIESYIATTKFLSFSLLSQLWDAQHEKTELKGLDMDDVELATAENARIYDYLHLLRTCYDILKKNGIQPFISEISESVERLAEGNESFENYRFIESVRNRLFSGEIQEAEVNQLCVECEAVLTQLLVNAAFLSKYKLLTIKDIKVFSPKRLANEFIHHYAELNTTSREDIWEDDLPLRNFTNSHSVLLTPRTSDEEIKQYLNLSPFVMDKSTFLGAQAPAVYAFDYMQDGNLFFKSVDTDINAPNNESDLLQINATAKEYELVWNQFDLFTKDLNA